MHRSNPSSNGGGVYDQDLAGPKGTNQLHEGMMLGEGGGRSLKIWTQ